MPTAIEPMRPSLSRQPFSNPEWLFEPKWDGYRAICFLQDGKVRLVSRNRKSLTENFPQLQSIVHLIKAKRAVLDGEVVALDKNGLPCFEGLRSRKAAAECHIVFYAFDLLYLNGRNLTREPLSKRKLALKKILPEEAAGRVRYTDHVVGSGEPLFVEIERLGLEGMVAKKMDSLYVGGRTRSWLKIKTQAGKETMQKRQEAWHS